MRHILLVGPGGWAGILLGTIFQCSSNLINQIKSQKNVIHHRCTKVHTKYEYFGTKVRTVTVLFQIVGIGNWNPPPSFFLLILVSVSQ